ncbi:hypothetical protein MRB53_003884 [Persea americana]|uniref:Uncharacterized protein n=1 Tax=Persea americana TaxID=3435 RepID=A0ACC2MYM3_PERAE|nr:hypothetical protein MRB53_003884 [Persea americana]
MHEDICSVALDHSISLILLPFQKQWSIDGGINIIDSALQIINPNVVAEAPCSVGLLVDCSTTTCTTAGISSQLHRIAAIFIGGPHDCEGEADSGAVRPRREPPKGDFQGEAVGRGGDGVVPSVAAENKRVVMREERVTVGEEILSGIRHLGMDYDLMMVGRSHGLNLVLLEGLLLWCDNPELGVNGDMPASADFSHGRVSVLVIQQQLSLTDISDTHNHLGKNQFRLH